MRNNNSRFIKKNAFKVGYISLPFVLVYGLTKRLATLGSHISPQNDGLS